MSKRFNQNEFQTIVIVRAWKDREFKKHLLSNPRAALKELGYDLPQTLNIKIKQEEPNTLTLVLPNEPSNVQSLSEEELKRVAAGNVSVGCTAFDNDQC